MFPRKQEKTAPFSTHDSLQRTGAIRYYQLSLSRYKTRTFGEETCGLQVSYIIVLLAKRKSKFLEIPGLQESCGYREFSMYNYSV